MIGNRLSGQIACGPSNVAACIDMHRYRASSLRTQKLEPDRGIRSWPHQCGTPTSRVLQPWRPRGNGKKDGFGLNLRGTRLPCGWAPRATMRADMSRLVRARVGRGARFGESRMVANGWPKLAGTREGGIELGCRERLRPRERRPTFAQIARALRGTLMQHTVGRWHAADAARATGAGVGTLIGAERAECIPLQLPERARARRRRSRDELLWCMRRVWRGCVIERAGVATERDGPLVFERGGREPFVPAQERAV